MSITPWSLTEGSIGGNVETLEVVSVAGDSFSDCDDIQQSLNSELTADSESVETTDASAEVSLDPQSGITASPTDTAEIRPKGRKRRGIRAFFQRSWRSVKRLFLCCHGTRVEPIVPPLQPDTHSSYPELKSVRCASGLEQRPDREQTLSESLSVTGPSRLEQTSHADPAVPENAPDTDSAESELSPDTDSAESELLLPDLDSAESDSSPDTDSVVSLPQCVSGSLCSETTDDVDSHYTVGRLLGSGSFGMVYEGTRKADGQKVAIKLLSKCADDRYLVIPGHSQPLLTEVALMRLMREPPISPYVVQMLEWFEDSKDIEIIMEYPHPCESLHDFIFHHDELIEMTARVLMHQAVLAVQHCIDHGVFHTDIHSDNMLVNTSTLQLKLIDFGCGQLFSTDAYKRCQYRGAADYCPPEILTEPTFHAVPANVWSLGLILFEMVNGCLPYDKSEEVLFVNPDLSRGWT